MFDNNNAVRGYAVSKLCRCVWFVSLHVRFNEFRKIFADRSILFGFPFAFLGLVVIATPFSPYFAVIARGAARMLWQMCEIMCGVGRRNGDRGENVDKIAPPDSVDSSDRAP